MYHVVMRRRMRQIAFGLAVLTGVTWIGSYFVGILFWGHVEFEEGRIFILCKPAPLEEPGVQIGWGMPQNSLLDSLRPFGFGRPFGGVIIALWPFPLIFGGLAVMLRSPHRTAQFCPKCGYDLRATPQRCPECGVEVAVENRSAIESSRIHH